MKLNTTTELQAQLVEICRRISENFSYAVVLSPLAVNI
jgi:hypothetical protein